MARLTIIILLLSLLPSNSLARQKPTNPASRNPSAVSSAEIEEWATLQKRFAKYGYEYVMSTMWALIHTYESKSQLDETMRLFEVLLNAMANNDPGKLRAIGGLKGFQNRFVHLLNSDDGMIAGFAARVLAVCFGNRYAPQIVTLMNKRDKSWTDENAYPTTVSRGHAAIALSILETAEHEVDIAKLLESMNLYDRSGAASALAKLRATQYADAIANLLSRKESTFRRDASPIYALVEMGVGQKYEKAIAQALDEDFSSNPNDAAVYALAHLKATKYAPKIATLLDQRYRRGNAAKALAIMGAKEYVEKIALLLDDDDAPLDQSAALLALGVLNATDYAPKVASVMSKKRHSFVSNFAAISLVLMEATDYKKEVIEVLKVNKTGTYVDAGELNPLVAEEAREINQRAVATLEKFRSRN
jgi:HEAT repeat protein